MLKYYLHLHKLTAMKDKLITEMFNAISDCMSIEGVELTELMEAAQACAKIADEQSVLFNDWILNNRFIQGADGEWYGTKLDEKAKMTEVIFIAKSTEQLLQKFKEESK